VHELVTIITDRINARFNYEMYIIRLFQTSTCFEQTRSHHQEVSCVIDCTRCCINTIDLLMMTTCLLETC